MPAASASLRHLAPQQDGGWDGFGEQLAAFGEQPAPTALPSQRERGMAAAQTGCCWEQDSGVWRAQSRIDGVGRS